LIHTRPGRRKIASGMSQFRTCLYERVARGWPGPKIEGNASPGLEPSPAKEQK
jgi:hypothetical protein